MIIQKGSKGYDVKLLQFDLARLGFAAPFTGKFEDDTLSAVKLFQQKNNLTVDGIVGDASWAVLDSKCIQGIDIYHGSAPINWNRLSPRVKFVYIKASEGAGFKDPLFEANVQAARAKNLIVGFYHFWTLDDPKAQFQNIMDQVKSIRLDLKTPGILPIVVDVEDQVGTNANKDNNYINNNPAVCKNSVLQLLGMIEKETGVKPIIYSYRYYLDVTLRNSSALAGYPLWLSAFQQNRPTLPQGWQSALIWQWSQYDYPQGVGSCDCNIFLGDINQYCNKLI